MQTGHVYYRSIGDAFYKIASGEGLLGLYRGLGTTLMVSVPNLAISYCIYGTLKEHLWQLKHPGGDVLEASREEPLFLESMICGATSGICSSLITYPIDVVRRRLQVLGLHRPGDHRGAMHEFQSIMRAEGLRGLYRGLAPELLKVTPMVGFTFCTYEFMKDLLGV
jgi:solute carrier family 25 (mitochondrial phosphate transporter), member 23/24/25/41